MNHDYLHISYVIKREKLFINFIVGVRSIMKVKDTFQALYREKPCQNATNLQALGKINITMITSLQSVTWKTNYVLFMYE